MSFLVAPPNHRNDHSPDGDDVDQLLRAFYRAEMPDPWPSFAAPGEGLTLLPFPVRPARRSLLRRSRLALAAAVALLLGGLAMMSGKFTGKPAEKQGLRVIGDPGATRTSPGGFKPVAIEKNGGEVILEFVDPGVGP